VAAGALVPVAPAKSSELPDIQITELPWERDALILKSPDGVSVDRIIMEESIASVEEQAAEAYQYLRLTLSNWLVSTRDPRGPAAATEIASLLAQMDAEETLGPLSLLVLRDQGEASAGTREFMAQLPCPVRMEPRVAPRLPASPWDLEPTVLVDRRLVKAQQGERKKIMRLGIAVYAVLFTAALVYISIPLVRRYLIEQELAGIVVEAEKIRQAALSWREAGALVNPKMNALELLWQVSRPLIEKDPAEIEGVRLTSFDYNTKRLLLQGEGKDLEQTEKYFEWLKKEPMLAAYEWKHPQPSLLPNGNARFQAEGLPIGSQVSEEGGPDANPDAQ
jgi:hypothetical protein